VVFDQKYLRLMQARGREKCVRTTVDPYRLGNGDDGDEELAVFITGCERNRW